MKTLLTITLCLLCCTACATENQLRSTPSVIPPSTGGTPGHRTDYDTDGNPSLMSDSLFTNAVLWLPFSRDDGTNVYDLSASGNDGFSTNGATPTWSSDDGGTRTFDGTNHYINMGSAADLAFALDDPFSITAWVKISAPEVFGIAGKCYFNTGELNQRGFYLSVNYFSGIGHLQLVFEDIGVGVSSHFYQYGAATVSDGAWHHAAATYNGNGSTNGIVLYVDGLETYQLSQEIGTVTTISTNISFIVGGISTNPAASGLFFKGTLDDLQVFDRVLTSNEVFTMNGDTQH
jgi:hypothetical protein